MVFWHIRILYRDKKSGSTTYSYETDLSEDNVKTFAKQFQAGSNVFFGGRWLDPFSISEVLIYQTEEHSSNYETDNMTGSSAIFTQKKGMPVTRNYILKQPKPQKQIEEKVPETPTISENIFIVHGRDTAHAYELARILEQLKLNPILLSEQPSGSLTIIEKLEKYSDVGYAFVILTPDDVGRLESEQHLHSRARQNVILEFGYFIGLLGRGRVACLYKGDIELPSDMHGVVYVQFNKSVKEIYWYIIKELKAVGYSINV
jgi:predicted nucleotide-binding protein